MSAVSDYFHQQIVNNFLRNEEAERPVALYLGLFTGSPEKDFSGIGLEADFEGYERVLCELSAFDPETGTVTNTNNLVFPASEGSMQYICTHAGVCPSENELYLFGLLDQPITVVNNTIVIVPAGELTLRVI